MCVGGYFSHFTFSKWMKKNNCYLYFWAFIYFFFLKNCRHPVLHFKAMEKVGMMTVHWTKQVGAGKGKFQVWLVTKEWQQKRKRVQFSGERISVVRLINWHWEKLRMENMTRMDMQPIKCSATFKKKRIIINQTWIRVLGLEEFESL